MCGFLVYKDGEVCDFSKIILRGGDGVSLTARDGFQFKHSLLSITGSYTPQPYIDGDIHCVYNGEIYNHPFTRSDGEVLIPLYKEYGSEFPRYLDGEFAIALYDFANGIACFATDTFASKPLFVRGLSCSSYRTDCSDTRIPANSIIVKRIRDEKILDVGTVHTFNFDSQTVDSYDVWVDCFKEAIKKRGKHRCFIGLSSGYDSGAIACELHNQGVDFKAFSITNAENPEVILERFRRLPSHERHALVERHYYSVIDHIAKHVEDIPYNLNFPTSQTSLFKDNAIVGLGAICEAGKEEGRKVYISGQGSDEILSDYGKWHSQSTFKGTFPPQLYEWENFRGGCQRAYLSKEEYIAGSYGIETRYPFLDKALVQAFLNLTPAFKNAHYKAPLREYLMRNSFPFEEDVKRGFNP